MKCQAPDFLEFSKQDVDSVLYHTAVHAGQALYTPAGFLWHESTLKDSDLVGAKAVVFLRAPKEGGEGEEQDDESAKSMLIKGTADTLADITKALMKHGMASSEILSAASDALVE